MLRMHMLLCFIQEVALNFGLIVKWKNNFTSIQWIFTHLHQRAVGQIGLIIGSQVDERYIPLSLLHIFTIGILHITE